MDRIALRELRNQASRVVRRARAGERMIITVDGVPAAEIGPVRAAEPAASLDELIATGAVVAAKVRTAPPSPIPGPAPTGRSSSDVLRVLRER
jgi:prevent-host-death family protein